LQSDVNRIQLCGALAVTIAGRRIEEALPGWQGRLAFGYLASNRTRPTSRTDLIEVLWPDQAPAIAAATQGLHKTLLATNAAGKR
jgi:DNA-binding SARP family transcriptional activator